MKIMVGWKFVYQRTEKQVEAKLAEAIQKLFPYAIFFRYKFTTQQTSS